MAGFFIYFYLKTLQHLKYVCVNTGVTSSYAVAFVTCLFTLEIIN